MKTWGSEGVDPPFLMSALDGGDLSASCPGRFTSRDRAPTTHWIGGWVNSWAGLDVVEQRKISFPYRELNPGRPGRRLSLYRLSYPDYTIFAVTIKFPFFLWTVTEMKSNTNRYNFL
jgi:hypothetical protein